MPMMFFYFLKIIFDISTSKRSKKYKPHSILATKKKNSNFHKTQVETHYQTQPKQRSESHVPYKFAPLKARFKGRYSSNFISLQGKQGLPPTLKLQEGWLDQPLYLVS
jgi:hypothetical protein